MDNIDVLIVLKLWDVANTAVALCVAQTMAFIYQCTNTNFGDQLRNNRRTLWLTLMITVVGYILYFWIIYGCQMGYEKLKVEKEIGNSIWLWATFSRLFIISFLTVISLIAIRIVRKHKAN